jgi:hypothetical protein
LARFGALLRIGITKRRTALQSMTRATSTVDPA